MISEMNSQTRRASILNSKLALLSSGRILSREKTMRKEKVLIPTFIGLASALFFAGLSFEQTPATQTQPAKTRRSQRVRMQEVQVASPDGNVKFTLLPNAERLTYTVMLGNTAVLEPSTLVMKLDGYDLSTGVIL